MRKPIVCLDIDGVVLDLMYGLHLYLKQKCIDFDYTDVKKYNFKYDTLGFDRKIIFDAFQDEELYAITPFYDGAVEAVKKLHEIAEIKSYTKISKNQKVYERRLQLCQRLGLQGEPFTGHQKPVDFSADYLVDDCLDVHAQWISENSEAKKILISQPYNLETNEDWSSSHFRNLIRVKNLQGAVEYICNDIKQS